MTSQHNPSADEITFPYDQDLVLTPEIQQMINNCLHEIRRLEEQLFKITYRPDQRTLIGHQRHQALLIRACLVHAFEEESLMEEKEPAPVMVV